MKAREIVLWCCAVILGLIVCGRADTDVAESDQHSTAEARLLKDLLLRTNRRVRPVSRYNESINISFGLILLSIQLNEETEVFTVEGWTILNWNNEYLKWNSEDYDNITTIRIPPEDIWQPDIMVYNGIGDGMSRHNGPITTVVYNSGEVHFLPPVTIQSRCALDFAYFPYDTQKCTLDFGSWSHDGSTLNLTFSQLDNSTYMGHKEFDLVDTSAKRYVRYYSCCVERFIDIDMSFSLRRRTTAALRVSMAPSIVLSFMPPVIFILPPGRNEKIILGVGIIIGQVLSYGQLVNSAPHAYRSTPYAAVFSTISITLVCFSLAMSAVIVNVWSRQQRRPPLPHCVTTVFLDRIGRLLRVSGDDFLPIPDPIRHQDADSEAANTELASRFDGVQMIPAAAMIGQWRQLACVLDRLLLLIFTCTVSICLFVFIML